MTVRQDKDFERFVSDAYNGTCPGTSFIILNGSIFTLSTVY